MSNISGRYRCEVETPIGQQAFVLIVEATGASFKGSAEGAIGGDSGALRFEGTVDGNEIAWSMPVPKPMPITLACRATIDGDALSGKVKAGIFGSYPITGTRMT